MCDSDHVIVKGNKLEKFRDLVKKSKNVIAFFMMPWCGACRDLKPTFALYRDVCVKNESKLVMIIVDGVTAPDVFDAYDVTAFPQVLTFVDGEETNRIIGSDKEALADEMKKFGLISRRK